MKLIFLVDIFLFSKIATKLRLEAPPEPEIPKTIETKECGICFDLKPVSDIHSSHCNHLFCTGNLIS